MSLDRRFTTPNLLHGRYRLGSQRTVSPSDTSQLVINTGTTIIIFLMVFLIQKT